MPADVPAHFPAGSQIHLELLLQPPPDVLQSVQLLHGALLMSQMSLSGLFSLRHYGLQVQRLMSQIGDFVRQLTEYGVVEGDVCGGGQWGWWGCVELWRRLLQLFHVDYLLEFTVVVVVVITVVEVGRAVDEVVVEVSSAVDEVFVNFRNTTNGGSGGHADPVGAVHGALR